MRNELKLNDSDFDKAIIEATIERFFSVYLDYLKLNNQDKLEMINIKDIHKKDVKVLSLRKNRAK